MPERIDQIGVTSSQKSEGQSQMLGIARGKPAFFEGDNSMITHSCHVLG